MVVARSWGGRNEELILRLPFGKQKLLKMDGGEDYTLVRINVLNAIRWLQ